MKAFRKLCVLLLLAAICGHSSRAQSDDSKVNIILHVARFYYVEEVAYCKDNDTNNPILKKINQDKTLTVPKAMMSLQNSKVAISEECFHAYLFELMLTAEIVKQIQDTDFIVNTVPRLLENVESEVEESITKAPASKRQTVHFIVNCQLYKKSNNSYQMMFEVRPMHGLVDSQQDTLDVQISDPKNPDIAKYYYAAKQQLFRLCKRTVDKQLHSQ
jgi:hypothetical protein